MALSVGRHWRSALVALIAFALGATVGLFAFERPKTRVRAPAPPLVAQAPEPITPVVIDMASWYPSAAIQLGTQAVGIAERVTDLSAGTMLLRFNEPDALARRDEVLAALADGAVDALWAPAMALFERDPAFALFSGTPFGPPVREFLAWFDRGGGRELQAELYGAMNVFALPCGVAAAEGGGWFRKAVRSSNDLKGLRIRTMGLAARVYQKVGAVPVELPFGETFWAFERGDVDAAELSQPAIDVSMGMHRVARYYYFPGWQQPMQIVDLMFSLPKWEELAPQQQAVVEAACASNIRIALADGEALQPQALADIQAAGATLERFPPPVLRRLRAAWDEVAAEEAERNESFRRVWESYRDFRDRYRRWRELSALD